MKLCKYAKDNLPKKIDDYIELTKDTKFICKKCGRRGEKKDICKAQKL